MKYVLIVKHSINTSLHSTLEEKTPYRTLFLRETVIGLQDFRIPETIALFASNLLQSFTFVKLYCAFFVFFRILKVANVAETQTIRWLNDDEVPDQAA